jgi:ACS family 4-hydroxyphenylacetate permease-like MFS transporter
MVNFIDRTNIGFAALTMNRDLHLSATTFGLSVTFFSAVYLLFEIPSNLVLARVGARKWLARIAVTWGIASVCCMFVVGAKSLIGMRMLVGMAEAGFAPGSVLYLTYWFPQYHRARAHMKYMIAQPIAGALGATISGLVLGLNGVFGIAGWRWLFLVEGLPSVILGVIAFYYLTDKPTDAKWLSAREKTTLLACLKRDADERDAYGPAPAGRSVTSQILSRNFLLVCFAYGCLIGNAGALGTWMPQIIRGMNTPGMPYWTIGLLSAIPPVCTVFTMPLWTRHADRTRERFWHCVAPMFVGAVGWVIAAEVADPGLRLAGLVVANICVVAAWPVFFTLPSLMLARESHPAGIAFLNVIGIVGTAITPIIMGAAKDLTGVFTAGMIAMAAILIIGGASMFLVPRRVLASYEEDDRALAATAPAVRT